MKILGIKSQKASVLIVALLTITIMTLICATSLIVISQNAGSGMQTAGWQQAMSAAESGVDVAIRALNAGVSGGGAPWTNWKQNTTTGLPTSGAGYSYEPYGGNSTVPAAPIAGQYNYLPSSAVSMNFATNMEDANTSSFWVTIDTAGASNLNSSPGNLNSQWYRIRSTGQTSYPTNSTLMHRVSNNRLDNDLRNSIALAANRKGGTFTQPTITRTIEVIVQPQNVSTVTVTNPFGGRGMYLRNSLTMSGGGSIGHFSGVTAGTFATSPATYRSTDYSGTLVGLMNANGSNIGSSYIYGGLAYSTTGSAPSGTSHVQGAITTPFTTTAPTTSDPSWSTGTPDATYTGGGSLPFSSIGPGAANTQANPYKVKINGDFTVPGGKSLTITNPVDGSGNQVTTPTYIEFWITGKFTTSGSGFITQQGNVHVTYYVDSSVTTSGSSFASANGFAGNTQFIVVGSGSVTISGGGNFIGTVEAPNSAVTVSGTGMFIGSLIGNTMNISGGASYYYDDALTGWTGGAGNISTGTVSTGSYSFASWFEDNSDPTRSARDVNNNNNSIVY